MFSKTIVIFMVTVSLFWLGVCLGRSKRKWMRPQKTVTLWDAQKEWRDADLGCNWAKVLIEVINYSRWSLSDPIFSQVEGSEPIIGYIHMIQAGFIEGYYTQQMNYGGSTEGMMAWRITDDIYCLVYWYVESKQTLRRYPNKLGLGCPGDRKSTESAIRTIRVDGIDASESVQVENFKQKHSMRHCQKRFCITGTMPPGTQVNVSIRFVPENVSDWKAEAVTQRDINELLEISEELQYEDDDSPVWNGGLICLYILLPILVTAIVVISGMCMYKLDSAPIAHNFQV